jgi:uncharacterized membrane protein HdeD (DUF308 family)
MKTLFEEMNRPVKHGWMAFLQGIIYVAVGLYMMLAPAVSYLALSVFFSVSILVNGVLEILFAASNRHRPNWGWRLGGGVIDLLIGVFLVVYPIISVEVIPVLMAFWLLFRGRAAIGDAIDMKHYNALRCVTYTILGVLAVLCALFMLWQPAIGMLYALYIISVAFVVIGAIKVFSSFECGSCSRAKRHSSEDDS